MCLRRSRFLKRRETRWSGVEKLREWARGFERKCRQEDWLSRAKLPLVFQEAVLAGQEEAPFRLVLTGFDRCNAGATGLIDAFKEQGHDVVLVGTFRDFSGAGKLAGQSRRSKRSRSRRALSGYSVSWQPQSGGKMSYCRGSAWNFPRAAGDRTSLSRGTSTRGSCDWGTRLAAPLRVLPGRFTHRRSHGTEYHALAALDEGTATAGSSQLVATLGLPLRAAGRATRHCRVRRQRTSPGDEATGAGPG